MEETLERSRFAQTCFYLQLLDGVSSSADHQPHFAGWDQHLLHRGPALAVAVETRAVPAALHDLDKQSLCLPEKQSSGVSDM